ncbi:MAG: hypothetical protein FWD16_03495, partial [Clostridia bacterium]|nr:hypothetical protein [Clostridia bacterium]
SREYEEKKSAGIAIRTKDTDRIIITMDITVKPVTGSTIYHYGEISIRGVLPNEILADKITVLSGMKLFRRAKDLVDVFALTQCVRVLTVEIFEIIKDKSLVLGGFADLLTRRADAEHAYAKLRSIDNKPPFAEVYEYLAHFVQPFARREKTPRVWNSGSRVWEDLSD